MQQDFQRFLNWYLSPLTRMKRGAFNVVVFVALLPALLLPTGKGSALAGVGAIDPVAVQNMMASMQNAQSAEDVVRQVEQLRSGVRESGLANLGQELQYGQQMEKGFNWSAFVTVVTFLLLIPVFRMRLRDMGKSENVEQYVYVGLVYLSVVSMFAQEVLGLKLPMSLFLTFGTVSFLVMGWVCMSGSNYVPSSERGKGGF